MQRSIVPYVKARCGEDNHEHHEKTDPIKSDKNDPVWQEKHHNRLQLQRHPRDEGVVVIEVWDWERWHADHFLGGTHVNIKKYVEAPNESFEERLNVFESGKPGEDEKCVGYLNVTMKWEPEEEADVPHQKVFGANSADASEEDPGPSSSGRDLWIGGIPESFLDGITVEDATKRLREMCDTFGETDTVTIRKKLGPGSWALVQFAEPESMDRAIAAGLTTDDGVELRVKEADVYGTISEGKSDGMLFQLAQHHGLKKLKPGILWVIVNSGEELAPSKKVIRDLSTYVDYGQLLNSLGVLFGYILIAFIFYRGYMSAGDASAEDVALNFGDNGDWDGMNTLVFMITSFTTVGYGNHPSFVTTVPPCEYPGPETKERNPFSNLMPVSMRQKTYADVEESTQFGNPEFGNDPLPSVCFSSLQQPPPECWVIADANKIFDFSTLRMYDRTDPKEEPQQYARAKATDEAAADGSSNATARFWPETSEAVRVPGDIDELKCTEEELSNETTVKSDWVPTTGEPWLNPGGACWAKYVDLCEEQHLEVWRKLEGKKTTAKLFTILFIVAGIGILGTVAGSFGEEIGRAVHGFLHRVDWAMDQALVASTAGLPPTTRRTGLCRMFFTADGGVKKKVPGNKKEVIVCFLGLFVIIIFGTVMYAWIESMAYVDALYFTVVTATTVGFGDYTPNTYGGKAFTVFYVPVSVVMVAAAIQRVASVPLKKRALALEDHVLSQFGKSIQPEDFEQIRRATGLRQDEDIRPNDFMLAMLVRLGRLDPDDMIKCRRLFSKLDRDCSGTLNDFDIQALLASAPDTSFIDDATFDTYHHEIIDNIEPAGRTKSMEEQDATMDDDSSKTKKLSSSKSKDQQGTPEFDNPIADT